MASHSKLVVKNSPLLEELIEKRHSVAKLFNFSSYADYKLKDLMAKNASTVQEFEEDLARKTIQSAHKDYLELQDVKRDYTKQPNATLEPWDKQFFGKIQLEKKYKI